jgi:hypothetical protein
VSSCDERLRPPVQLADPVPRMKSGERLARFELSVVLRLHAKSPRYLADGEPAPLSIVTEEIGECSRTGRAREGLLRDLRAHMESPERHLTTVRDRGKTEGWAGQPTVPKDSFPWPCRE